MTIQNDLTHRLKRRLYPLHTVDPSHSKKDPEADLESTL